MIRHKFYFKTELSKCDFFFSKMYKYFLYVRFGRCVYGTYLKRPRDFSAAAFPISEPFFFRPSESIVRSFPHRLHWVRRAKFKFLQLVCCKIPWYLHRKRNAWKNNTKYIMNHFSLLLWWSKRSIGKIIIYTRICAI